MTMHVAADSPRNRHAELAFTDTGIASHLIGQDAFRLSELDGAAGQMIENFVIVELARQLTWDQSGAGGINHLARHMLGRLNCRKKAMHARRRVVVREDRAILLMP